MKYQAEIEYDNYKNLKNNDHIDQNKNLYINYKRMQIPNNYHNYTRNIEENNSTKKLIQPIN